MLPKSDCKTFQKGSHVDTETAPGRVTVRLHAPTKGWFTASLIIAALIYPIAVPAVAFVLSLFLMPETRERSIWDEAATAQKA